MFLIMVEVKVMKFGFLVLQIKCCCLSEVLLVVDFVYGLVNVCIDGDCIVCVICNESDGSWNIKEVWLRF